jgi:hypothetical protein
MKFLELPLPSADARMIVAPLFLCARMLCLAITQAL